MIAIAYPILLVPYISITYDVIGRAWNAAEMRVEYIVVREIYIHFGSDGINFRISFRRILF